MDSKFKAGDVVRIKERTALESHYRCMFTDDMANLADNTFTIKDVQKDSETVPIPIVADDGYIYTLIGSKRSWSSSMLEKSSPLFKVGDKVRVIERKSNAGDYRFSFVDKMTSEVGKIFTISDIRGSCSPPTSIKDDGYCYYLYEYEFSWASSMLEKASDTPTTSVSESDEPDKSDKSDIDFTHKRKHYTFNFSL